MNLAIMKTNVTCNVIALSAFTLLGSAHIATAQNIVQDPGFEGAIANNNISYNAPAFIGDGVWQVTSGEVAIYKDTGKHSGSQYAAIYTSGVSSLSQSLVTTPGATYDLSFYAQEFFSGDTFAVTFDGITIPGIPSTLPANQNGYTLYTATGLLASGGTTALVFSGSSPSGEINLDDVSVTPQPSGGSSVPEPDSIALFVGLASVGVSLLRRKRRK